MQKERKLCSTIFDEGLKKLKNDVIYEAIREKGYCLLFFMKKALHINLLYHMECTPTICTNLSCSTAIPPKY